MTPPTGESLAERIIRLEDKHTPEMCNDCAERHSQMVKNTIQCDSWRGVKIWLAASAIVIVGAILMNAVYMGRILERVDNMWMLHKGGSMSANDVAGIRQTNEIIRKLYNNAGGEHYDSPMEGATPRPPEGVRP